MRRQAAIGLISASLLALAFAGTALAKGQEVGVALLPPPTDPHAGAPITLGVKITFPNGAPVSGEMVEFTLAQIGGSGLVGAVAKEREPGNYYATLTLPTKGGWTIGVAASGGEVTQEFRPGVIRMLAPVATSASPSSPAPLAPSWAVILALAGVAVAGGAGALVVANRRRAAVEGSRS
jgi:hypothetical protein